MTSAPAPETASSVTSDRTASDPAPRRASPLPPDERRRAILDAALPLVAVHGRGTTTKQIAEAAGIAEGTIFRVFATKDELFSAALDQAFDPSALIRELEGVDLGLPLRERLLAATRVVQHRFRSIFTVMTALGLVGPPQRLQEDGDGEVARRRSAAAFAALVEPDADALRVPVTDVVRLLRLLTFSGSHPHLSADSPLSPEQIVDVILHGTLRPTPGGHGLDLPEES